MRVILANNASAVLTAPITDMDTSMVLESVSSNLSVALGSLAGGSGNQLVVLTISNPENTMHEVVTANVWDAATSTATIVRAQDDTTAQSWAAGSKVEVRPCKMVLESVVIDHGVTNSVAILPATPAWASGDNSVTILGGHTPGTGDQSVSIGLDARGHGTSCVAVGKLAQCYCDDGVVVGTAVLGGTTGLRGVAIGQGAQCYSDDGVAIKGLSGSTGINNVSIGKDSEAYRIHSCALAGGIAVGEYSIAIGKLSQVRHQYSLAIGYDIWVDEGCGNCVAIGPNAYITEAISGVAIGQYAELHDDGISTRADYSIAIGMSAMCGNTSCIAIGDNTYTEGIFATSIGARANAKLNHSTLILGYQYLKKSALSGSPTGDIPGRQRTSAQIIISTGVLDLTSGAAAETIAIPSGSHFFPDRVDVVVTSASAPGGSPAIQVGTSSGSPTDILAASAVTVDTAYQRQSFTPTSPHGVTGVHVSVGTAGTGTLTARVVVTGYLVEDE